MLRSTLSSAPVSSRRAVSLVDLVITVLVMGILSAVAAPRFSGALSMYRVETAAEKIVADLNYARQYARQTSENHAVSFTLDPPGYTLNGIPSLDKSGNDYSVDLTDLGFGVAFTSVDFDNELDFVFNQYGRPLNADASAALGNGTVVVQSGSNSATVEINLDTGKAEVQ